MTEFFRDRRSGGGSTFLVLDRPKIGAMSLPGGSIFRWANSVVREIVFTAKGELYPEHGFRSGEMYTGIDSSVTPAGFGEIFASVRSAADHTIFYHEGTAPHRIEGRKYGYLKFVATSGIRAGQIVRPPAVDHPGFKGRPFLRQAMEATLARRGIARS